MEVNNDSMSLDKYSSWSASGGKSFIISANEGVVSIVVVFTKQVWNNLKYVLEKLYVMPAWSLMCRLLTVYVYITNTCKFVCFVLA